MEGKTVKCPLPGRLPYCSSYPFLVTPRTTDVDPEPAEPLAAEQARLSSAYCSYYLLFSTVVKSRGLLWITVFRAGVSLTCSVRSLTPGGQVPVWNLLVGMKARWRRLRSVPITLGRIADLARDTCRSASYCRLSFECVCVVFPRNLGHRGLESLCAEPSRCLAQGQR